MLRMPTKMCAKVSQVEKKKKKHPHKKGKNLLERGQANLGSEKFARLLHDEQSRRRTIFAYDLFALPFYWWPS